MIDWHRCISFFSWYASHLQKKDPDIKVKRLLEQNNALIKLKRNETNIKYQNPPINKQLKLSLTVFADASRIGENGQVETLAGLVVGELEEGPVFETLHCCDEVGS